MAVAVLACALVVAIGQPGGVEAVAAEAEAEAESESETETESVVVAPPEGEATPYQIRWSPVGIGVVPRLQWPRPAAIGEVTGLAIAAPWSRLRSYWGVMVGGVAKTTDFSGGLQVAVVADAEIHFGLQVGAVALAGELPKDGGVTISGATGVQLGGLLARSPWVDGVQASGGVAVAGDMYGLQTAGLVGSSRWTVGVQLAGVLARADETEGVQLGGLLALSHHIIGAQLAAGITYSNDPIGTGLQLAGALNIAEDEHTGVQLSALGNYAGCMTGVQVGLINVAGSLSGVQLGLVNIARRGGRRFMPVLNAGGAVCL